jgi:hypothetical protein
MNKIRRLPLVILLALVCSSVCWSQNIVSRRASEKTDLSAWDGLSSCGGGLEVRGAGRSQSGFSRRVARKDRITHNRMKLLAGPDGGNGEIPF